MIDRIGMYDDIYFPFTITIPGIVLKHKDGTITDTPLDISTEMSEWLTDNVGPQTTNWVVYRRPYGFIFRFESEKKALFFKLRFAGT